MMTSHSVTPCAGFSRRWITLSRCSRLQRIFLPLRNFAATACLIADIHMPEMTGVELYNHLVESGQAIPTILVTAHPDERPNKCMLARGVQCYLRKPLVEAALITAFTPQWRTAKHVGAINESTVTF